MATELTNSDNAGTVVSRINAAITEQNKGVSITGANPSADTVISRVNAAIQAEDNAQLSAVSSSDAASRFIEKVNALFGSINSGDTPTPPSPTTYEDAPSILIIGNSFTLDSWSYVPFLLKEYGINIKIGMYYYAAGSLGEAVNHYSVGGQSATNKGFFYIDTSIMDAWTQPITKSTMTIDGTTYVNPCPQQCVQYFVGMENELEEAKRASLSSSYEYANRSQMGKMWDIIVLQQFSTGSYTWSYYVSNGKHRALSMKELIDGDMKQAYSLGWNINHSRGGAANDLPTDILANIKDACTAGDVANVSTAIDIVFPYGTAIFNGRNTALKNVSHTISGTTYTDMWIDGQHLVGGIGHYLASLAIIEKLFREYYPNDGLSVSGNTTIPNSTWASGHDMPSSRATTIEGATAANCALAQQAAIDACDDPWTIVGGWPLTMRIFCNANCYIDSAPAAYGITQGAQSATFQIAQNTAISNIVIKTNEGYVLFDKSNNNHAYYKHRRDDGVKVKFSTESLGTEYTVNIAASAVAGNNIDIYFNAYAS